MVRQLADEADRVRDQRPHARLQFHRAVAGSSVAKRRSSTKISVPDSVAQDRRLAGVRVADQRAVNSSDRPSAAWRAAAQRPRASRAGPDAAADEAAVRLQLRLTRTAEPDTAADTRKVRPHPLQPRQHVLQLRQFHLHLRLAGPRARREDVEDQLRAVHHPRLQRLLEVLALRRRQLLVEDDERRFVCAMSSAARRPCPRRCRTSDAASPAAAAACPPHRRPPCPSAGQLLQVLVRLHQRHGLQRRRYQDAFRVLPSPWMLRLEYPGSTAAASAPRTSARP
jgi:hypothetical protein